MVRERAEHHLKHESAPCASDQRLSVARRAVDLLLGASSDGSPAAPAGLLRRLRLVVLRRVQTREFLGRSRDPVSDVPKIGKSTIARSSPGDPEDVHGA